MLHSHAPTARERGKIMMQHLLHPMGTAAAAATAASNAAGMPPSASGAWRLWRTAACLGNGWWKPIPVAADACTCVPWRAAAAVGLLPAAGGPVAAGFGPGAAQHFGGRGPGRGARCPLLQGLTCETASQLGAGKPDRTRGRMARRSCGIRPGLILSPEVLSVHMHMVQVAGAQRSAGGAQAGQAAGEAQAGQALR